MRSGLSVAAYLMQIGQSLVEDCLKTCFRGRHTSIRYDSDHQQALQHRLLKSRHIFGLFRYRALGRSLSYENWTRFGAAFAQTCVLTGGTLAFGTILTYSRPRSTNYQSRTTPFDFKGSYYSIAAYFTKFGPDLAEDFPNHVR
jgi:hypothetical protein